MAQAMHERIVNPTTHGLRRRLTSDNPPKNGTDPPPSADAIALAVASIVFETPRSLTSHTVKYRVATFIEKIVLEKSYNAQLTRSISGARMVARASPSARIIGITCSGCAMELLQGESIYLPDR